MNETTARRQALAALIAMSLIWSYNWIVMKAALAYIGPFDFSVLRSVFGTVLLFALLWIRGESLAPTPWRDTILIGLAQTTGFQALVQLALVNGGAGKTALLAYTMPFWVIAFAWILLGERPTLRHWLLLAIAAAGLVLVIEPWGAIGNLTSCCLAIAGGACWALGTVLAKRLFDRQSVTPLRLTAWQMLCGSIGMIVLAVSVSERPIEWSTGLIAAVAYNGIFAGAAAWTLWLFVVKRLPAGIAGVASLVTPLLGVFFAWLQLGETPDRVEACGIALIAVALLGLLRVPQRAVRV
jgi:drug/metabolite transporter (DMT)-like permease